MSASSTAVVSFPLGTSNTPSTGWNDDHSHQSLVELASAYPDAAVLSIEADGTPMTETAAFVYEIFPAGTREESFFGRALPHSRAGLVQAWQRALQSGGSRCLMVTTDAPNVTRVVYILRFLDSHGCMVVVAPREPVQATPGDADAFAVRVRRMKHIVDESSVIHHVDDETRAILGWDQSVIGESTLKYVHPADHERAIRMWIEMLDAPGSTRQVRVRYQHADGRWIWVETTNFNALDSEGCIFREVVDISDEVEATEAAKAREEVLHRLAGALPSGIAEWTPLGDVVFTNQRWSEITGTVDAAVEKLCQLAVHPEPEEVAAIIEAALADGMDVDRDLTLRAAGSEQLRHCKMSIRTVADDSGQLIGAVCCLDDVTDQWELTQTLEKQARSDALTDLPNRTSIVKHLEAALAAAKGTGTMTAVMFFDLKGFKLVNDKFGHAAGDLLLREVANTLDATLRPSDVVGRQGGDEFIVVCPDVTSAQAALRLAQRLQDSITTSFQIGDQRIECRATCGVALDVGGLQTPERLIAEADLAMYEQRRQRALSPGLARPELFTEQRLELDRDEALREAHRDGSLALYFQPLVHMGTGRVVGFESLLRWRFDGELVPPSEFIGLAERRGLINNIGEWAIGELCRVAALHRHTPDLRWTINVSPLQLRDDQVLEAFQAGLERYGLEASAFGIELTESVMMAETPEAANTLRKLDAAGFLLIVDDFGTGFASLDYLRGLPVGGLKIDRGFVAEMSSERTRAIVASVISLAKRLDLYLVAEGVETQEHFAMLKHMGAFAGQGYLFGRPTPEPCFVPDVDAQPAALLQDMEGTGLW